MELKALNIIKHEYKGYDDFYLLCEAFIGVENETYAYKVYDFNVISIKKLYNDFLDDGIMLNRGWMIMKYYNEEEIREKIISIIHNSTSHDEEETYANIDHYLRLQEADK